MHGSQCAGVTDGQSPSLYWPLMALNPYASFLGNKNPREVIAETPGRLASVLDTIGPERATWSPAPGKWSAREILCHLADCELVFAFRLRQSLAEPDHVIQPFDQDKWAASYAVSSFTTNVALEMFRAARGWNVRLIAALSAEQLERPVTHPERGAMTIETIVETMAGHDLNHFGQLQAIAAKTAGA
jgi:uncharacterized damage-inducible protein DinB